jgi:hypothetical protein
MFMLLWFVCEEDSFVFGLFGRQRSESVECDTEEVLSWQIWVELETQANVLPLLLQK